MKRNRKITKSQNRKHTNHNVSVHRGVYLSSNQIQRLYNRLCNLHEIDFNKFNECLLHLTKVKIYYNDTLKSIISLPDLPKVFVLPKFMLKQLVIAALHPTMNVNFIKLQSEDARRYANAMYFGYRSMLKQREYFNVDVDGVIIKDAMYQLHLEDYYKSILKDIEQLKIQAYVSFDDGSALIDYLAAAENIEKGTLNYGNK